jgi:alpha-1,6-mannosyltransferase
VRGTLGLLNSLALLYFQNGLRRAFGRITANWFILLQGSQFHVIYYMSRTLPNMYAFVLSKFSQIDTKLLQLTIISNASI